MPPTQRIRIFSLAFIFFLFAGFFLFTTRQMSSVLAADEQKLWVDNDWNILTMVPKGWTWKEKFAADVPVVFLPEGQDNKGIPDFVFVTHLGKQTKTDLDKLKDDYIKGLAKDLDNFKLNSAERVTTREGLQAQDLSYTFTENKTEALGYDRLVFTDKSVLWAISFSAGKNNFKDLKDGAISIIDSFVFDAAKWLEKKQKK